MIQYFEQPTKNDLGIKLGYLQIKKKCGCHVIMIPCLGPAKKQEKFGC